MYILSHARTLYSIEPALYLIALFTSTFTAVLNGINSLHLMPSKHIDKFLRSYRMAREGLGSTSPHFYCGSEESHEEVTP
jgi:hypothetical protein